jgi:hypothetical protein
LPHNLTLDPAAVRPDQKRHDARNILRVTEAAEWVAGPGGFDLRLGLAGHEKVRFDSTGRDRVDGYTARADLFGEDAGQRLDARFARGIGAVGRRQMSRTGRRREIRFS